MGILEILLMIASVILIILSLLQSGKSDGLGSAFGGSDNRNYLFRSCYNYPYFRLRPCKVFFYEVPQIVKI